MFVFREVAPTSAKPRPYPALFSRNRKADLTAVSKVATLAARALSMMQGSNIGAASIARTRGSTLRHTDESPENVIIGEREVGEPAVLDRARDVLGRSCGQVIRQQLPSRSLASWPCGEPRMTSCFSAAPRYSGRDAIAVKAHPRHTSRKDGSLAIHPGFDTHASPRLLATPVLSSV